MSSPMLVMPLPAGPLHNTPGNSHHHLGGISPTSARMRIPAHHSPYLAQHPVHQPWQSPINQTSYNYAERSILQSPILPPSSSLYPAYQLIIPPLMGLANHGNSCFLNATLQILAHSPLLIQSILEMAEKSVCTPSSSTTPNRQLSRPVSTSIIRNEHSPATRSPARSPLRAVASFSSPTGTTTNVPAVNNRTYSLPCERCLHCILLRTLLSMNHNQVTNDVLANSTLSVIRRYADMPVYSFAPGRQEDAHELFANVMQLFQQGHRESPPAPSSSSSTNADKSIYEMFTGKTKSRIYCYDCQNITSMEEKIVDLSLEIARASDLRSALCDYFNTELLHGENAYQCETCQRKCKAQKCIRLEESPKVLAIQLKRFQYENKEMTKLNHHVTIGEELDLRDFYNRVNAPEDGDEDGYPMVDLRYDLKGIVVHVGDSPHNGHYVTYVKKRLYSNQPQYSYHSTSSRYVEKWFKIDDRHVKEVSVMEALQTQAYLLLYESKVWQQFSTSKVFHANNMEVVQQALSDVLYPSQVWRLSEAIWPQVNFTMQYDEYRRAEEELRQQRRMSHTPPQLMRSPSLDHISSQQQASITSSARNAASIKRTRSNDSASTASQRTSRPRTSTESSPRTPIVKTQDLKMYDVPTLKDTSVAMKKPAQPNTLKTLAKFFNKLIGKPTKSKQDDALTTSPSEISQSSSSSKERKRKREEDDHVDIAEVYIDHVDKDHDLMRPLSVELVREHSSSSHKTATTVTVTTVKLSSESSDSNQDNNATTNGPRKKAKKESKSFLGSLLKVFNTFRHSSEDNEEKIRKGPFKWT